MKLRVEVTVEDIAAGVPNSFESPIFRAITRAMLKVDRKWTRLECEQPLEMPKDVWKKEYDYGHGIAMEPFSFDVDCRLDEEIRGELLIKQRKQQADILAMEDSAGA